MIVNGYKITPAPIEGFPFRAVVHHTEFHPSQFVFLSRDHCELFCHYVDMLGEAARAYRAWVLEQQTEDSE